MRHRRDKAGSWNDELAFRGPSIPRKCRAASASSACLSTSARPRREPQSGAAEAGARRAAARGRWPGRGPPLTCRRADQGRVSHDAGRPARPARPSGRAARERLRNGWRPRENAPRDRKRIDPKGARSRADVEESVRGDGENALPASVAFRMAQRLAGSTPAIQDRGLGRATRESSSPVEIRLAGRGQIRFRGSRRDRRTRRVRARGRARIAVGTATEPIAKTAAGSNDRYSRYDRQQH